MERRTCSICGSSDSPAWAEVCGDCGNSLIIQILDGGIDYLRLQHPPKTTTISESNREPIRCPGCGYELTGLPTDRCPECGKWFDRAQLYRAVRERGGPVKTSEILKHLVPLPLVFLLATVFAWYGQNFMFLAIPIVVGIAVLVLIPVSSILLARRLNQSRQLYRKDGRPRVHDGVYMFLVGFGSALLQIFCVAGFWRMFEYTMKH